MKIRKNWTNNRYLEGEPDNEGGGGDDWRSSISEEFRDTTMVKEAKSINDIVKSGIEAQKLVGGAIRPPGPDAGVEDRQKFYAKVREIVPEITILPKDDDAEGWAAFYNQLGRPEDGYSFDADDDLKKTMHAHGLSAKQAGAIAELLQNQTGTAAEARKEALIAEYEEISKGWGDAADTRWKQVTEVSRQLGGEDLADAINQADPKMAGAMIRALDKVVDMVSEKPDIHPGMQKTISSFGLTPDQAQAKIDEIYNNPDHVFWKPGHPNHEATLKQVEKLFEIVAPGVAA